ncbi:MAG: polyhydroxyalkanoate depolymerase [Alphaproteobacteria bacterium]|nr:polyhydroxyalkanoate depolymerase [Alphaproteobacteria bacterium]
MLYYLRDFSEAALTPLRWSAGAAQQMFSHPGLPISYTRFGRTVAAGAELFQRTTRSYRRPEFGLDSTVIDGETVAVRESVVLEKLFCDLRHFRRRTRRRDPKVLVVAPLSGHYPTLLRGTVEALLPQHDVYITDWRDPRDVPLLMGGFDLDDYIDYVIDFLDHLGPDTHVIAVCQPSVPVLAAVAIMAAEERPNQPRSMTLMGGPVDPRRSPTKVNELASSRPIDWFERTVIARVPMYYPGFMRRVYPGFLQLSGFMVMNLDRHVGAHLRLFQHLVEGDGDSAEAHRKFYDEYLSVMDLPADYYLQTLKTVFQDHALPNGTMVSRGRPIDPGAIRKTALLTVEGERDDVSGVGQTEAAHDLCVNLSHRKKHHHLQPEVGHYGIFNGRRWREEILPVVSGFMREHERRVLPRLPGF